MKVFDVTFRISEASAKKVDMGLVCALLCKLHNYSSFGTAQARKYLPTTGMRLRITSDQFVQLFQELRRLQLYSAIKWDDVCEVEEIQDQGMPFYDCTKKF